MRHYFDKTMQQDIKELKCDQLQQSNATYSLYECNTHGTVSFDNLKDSSPQKERFSHHHLTLLPMECWVKFHSLRNISGASQRKNVAAFS